MTSGNVADVVMTAHAMRKNFSRGGYYLKEVKTRVKDSQTSRYVVVGEVPIDESAQSSLREWGHAIFL